MLVSHWSTCYQPVSSNLFNPQGQRELTKQHPAWNPWLPSVLRPEERLASPPALESCPPIQPPATSPPHPGLQPQTFNQPEVLPHSGRCTSFSSPRASPLGTPLPSTLVPPQAQSTSPNQPSPLQPQPSSLLCVLAASCLGEKSQRHSETVRGCKVGKTQKRP